MESLLSATPKTLIPEICIDSKLIARYGGVGPRYASYPTALHFSDKFTVGEYQKHALRSNEVLNPRPLSLYVHIPFCQSLCYYCACHKVITRNTNRVNIYIDNLYEEIAMQAALFDDDRIVEQIHFGGGTPTYLSDKQLYDLLAHVRNRFNLQTGSEREFAIEVDPRSVTTNSISALAEIGFNRLSLGIQDFDPQVQQAVNRVQSAVDTIALVEHARDVKFKSISFDLIYGLPHQTVESFSRTLDTVIAIQPDRLAVYNYAHLPNRFKGQRMIKARDLPSPDVKLKILNRTIEKLLRASYIYIGMDHFALPNDELVKAQQNGTLQRNFQGYSTHRDCDLIGLGVSAIGHIENTYSQNASTTTEYQMALEAGKLPIRRGIEVDNDDRIRAEVIQQLMCYGQVDYSYLQRHLDTDFPSYFNSELTRLAPLQRDGLVELYPNRIQITATGRMLLRTVAMVFDRHLASESSDKRYSQTI